MEILQLSDGRGGARDFHLRDSNADRSVIEQLGAQTLVGELEGDGFLPFVAKIDIEGGEGELFSREVDWIDRFPLVIVELHDWLLPGERTSQPFLKCVAGRNRDFVYIGENIFSIRN